MALASKLKDDPVLQALPLAPAVPLTQEGEPNRFAPPIVPTFNRLGGLMTALGERIDIDVAAVLAVWLGDASNKPHVPGCALIYFDVDLFHAHWVNPKTQPTFDRHFGNVLITRDVETFRPGPSGKYQLARTSQQSLEQVYRNDPSAEFAPVHDEQASEYAAFELARNIRATEALMATKIGATQASLHNFKIYGYSSIEAMFDAFQADERWHVLTWLNWGNPEGQTLDLLRAHQWREFARFHHATDYLDYVGDQVADHKGERYGRLYENVAQILGPA